MYQLIALYGWWRKEQCNQDALWVPINYWNLIFTSGCEFKPETEHDVYCLNVVWFIASSDLNLQWSYGLCESSVWRFVFLCFHVFCLWTFYMRQYNYQSCRIVLFLIFVDNKYITNSAITRRINNFCLRHLVHLYAIKSLSSNTL